MNFGKDIARGTCSCQSNPTEELATFPNDFTSETSMDTQTFRMNDLMEEIQNMEPQNHVSAEYWATGYRNRLDQSNVCESIQSAEEATSQHRDPMSPQLLERYPYVSHEKIYEYPSSSACGINQMLDLEMVNMNEERNKCEEQVKDAEKPQEKVLESDDVIVQLEENKENKLIYYKNLSMEDVHTANTLDVAWSNAESFVRFLTNYIKTYQRREFDLNVETKYQFSKNNPYDNAVEEAHETGLWHIENHHPLHAILYFEAAVRVNPNDSEAWKYLIDILVYSEQYYDAFCLAKENLYLNLDYFSRIMYNFLFDEQHYYQGCQTIFNWLRSHPDYHDIIPPNYIMKNKVSSLVEDEQVADLKSMLIEAAHRKPDYYVHIALSKLHEISRDYKESNACITAAIKTRPENPWQDWINILYNLIRDNDPSQVLDILENLNKKRTHYSFRVTCLNVNGVVHMYLENYKKACQYLLATLDRLIVWKTSELCDVQKNTVWSELRLCIELMDRKDLLNLVEELNYHRLCEEFDYKPIV